MNTGHKSRDEWPCLVAVELQQEASQRSSLLASMTRMAPISRMQLQLADSLPRITRYLSFRNICTSQPCDHDDCSYRAMATSLLRLLRSPDRSHEVKLQLAVVFSAPEYLHATKSSHLTVQEYITNSHLDTSNVEAYVELHIEQGPLLENEGKQVGVVTGIFGASLVHVQFNGSGGHGGGMPMEFR